MNSVIVYNVVRIAVQLHNSGLFDRIAAVVRGLIGVSNMTGDDKKAHVKKYLMDNGIVIGGILLDGIIFATRLRYEK